MYAKVENGLVVEYPLSEEYIRASLPHMSIDPDFANNLPDGYVRVLSNSMPAKTNNQECVEILPEFVNGTWMQTWALVDKYTPEELAQIDADRIEAAWVLMRAKRHEALIRSDWVIQRHKDQKELGVPTSLSDAEYMAWLTYRQELRDFPDTVTNIDNYAFPTKPGELGVSNG